MVSGHEPDSALAYEAMWQFGHIPKPLSRVALSLV